MTIDPDSPLVCPGCGAHCLHHGNVRVFQRLHEDGEAVLTAISGKRTEPKFDDHPTPVPPTRLLVNVAPGRRGSIEIEFACETCELRPVLRMSQHKGSTYFEWLCE